MGVNKELRKRLEALRRPELTKDSDLAPSLPEAIVYPRELHPSPAKEIPPSLPPGPSLEIATGGIEVKSPSGGKALLIVRSARELDECPASLFPAFRRAFEKPDSPVRAWIRLVCGVDCKNLEDVLFIDLETTGLSSTPVFLIGTMGWEGEALMIRQIFARDYAEEMDILSLFVEHGAGRNLIISFNGKTFDIPYLAARSAVNAVLFRRFPHHLDLLHVARKLWKKKLDDCRLQSLEKYVCSRDRGADIRGADIPKAYHDFVRTGDARQMLDCLRHNQLDLLTLAELLLRLPAPK